MTDPALPEDNCNVAVVGGGTSGLALAAELERQSVGKVVVLERENEAGGVPRHCGHYPFGLSEYKRLLKGPDYARRNRETALRLGVEIQTKTTVTMLRPNGLIEILNPEGKSRIRADRVVLCTGVRESSRAQRLISGERPGGVVTTGALQRMDYLKNIKPFERPVVLGSKLVSLSAIQTCTHLGIKPVAMVEEQDRIVACRFFQTYPLLKRVPPFLGVSEPRILGNVSVEALTFTEMSGEEKVIETDGVIVPQRLCLSAPEQGVGRFHFGLKKPVRARLAAKFNGQQIWRGKLNARPVRRISVPMFEVPGNLRGSELTFSIE